MVINNNLVNPGYAYSENGNEPWGMIKIDGTHTVLFASAGAARLLQRPVTAGMPLAELLPEMFRNSDMDGAGSGAGMRYVIQMQKTFGRGVELPIGENWIWLKRIAPEGIGRFISTLALVDITEMRRVFDDRLESLRFMSHDLRSPQNSIVALTQLFEYDPQVFEECGGMQRVAELARYSLSLGDQFMFTSATGKLQDRDLAPVDLCAMICDLIPQLEVAAVYRGVPLRLAQSTAAWISGVRVFVARALQNLIDNAIHVSPAGAPVTVSLKTADGFAHIRVSDQAGGMPGLAQGIMSDFDGLADLSSSGFGLGLKLTARIVRLHGGTMYAEANANAGSDFVIRLPCLGGGANPHKSVPRQVDHDIALA